MCWPGIIRIEDIYRLDNGPIRSLWMITMDVYVCCLSDLWQLRRPSSEGAHPLGRVRGVLIWMALRPLQRH